MADPSANCEFSDGDDASLEKKCPALNLLQQGDGSKSHVNLNGYKDAAAEQKEEDEKETTESESPKEEALEEKANKQLRQKEQDKDEKKSLIRELEKKCLNAFTERNVAASNMATAKYDLGGNLKPALPRRNTKT